MDILSDDAHGIEGVFRTWPKLRDLLRDLRAWLSSSDWAAARSLVREHRIHSIALEDPFTRHSWEKPSGYPGDARLIDHIYRMGAAPGLALAASPRGKDINTFTTESAACVAVRERLWLLARLVDATAERVRGAEVMALASGHLREAALASAASSGRLSRWLALDQDTQSASEAIRVNAHLSCVLPVESSIGRLIVRPSVFGKFDLVYAAGLYDYLDTATAIRLGRAVLEALKPGGRFLFANFANSLPDEGYMDAIMDWRLIQRGEPDMLAIVGALSNDEISSKLFYGNNRNIMYALLKKVG